MRWFPCRAWLAAKKAKPTGPTGLGRRSWLSTSATHEPCACLISSSESHVPVGELSPIALLILPSSLSRSHMSAHAPSRRALFAFAQFQVSHREPNDASSPDTVHLLRQDHLANSVCLRLGLVSPRPSIAGIIVRHLSKNHWLGGSPHFVISPPPGLQQESATARASKRDPESSTCWSTYPSLSRLEPATPLVRLEFSSGRLLPWPLRQ